MVSYRSPTECGFGLLVFVLALLSFSLLAIALSSKQMLGQFMHLHLQQAGIERQHEIERAFNQLALQLTEGQHGSPMYALTPLKLEGLVRPDECPHPYSTLTRCWLVQVTDRRNNAIRERLLLIPGHSCGEPYWYASASTLTLDSTLSPPTEEFPDDPVFPPKRPGQN